jgi:hypothetical protein
MVADVPAQVPSLFADQDDTPELVEQTPSVPTESAVVPASATDERPASESPDLSTLDGIRKEAERNEALKNFLEKQRLDTENTVRQRLQNEWKREQGSVERANAYHQSLIDRLNEGEDIETLKRETPNFVKANEEWTRSEVLRSLAEQAITLAAPDEAEALKSLLDEAKDVESVTRVTGSVLNAITNKVKRETLDGLDFEELNKHPRFTDWMTSQVKARLEEEMSAQKTQESIRQNPPAIPTGGASEGGINASEFANMPEREQNRLLETLTEEQVNALLVQSYELARGG